MNLSEFANQVAANADTNKTQINVAEVKRVLALGWDVLAALPTDEAFALISKGVANSKRKKVKK